MESIANKIIDIDRRADERISEAKKRREEILAGMAEECSKLKSELSAAADKRIAEVERINRSELEAMSAELEENYRKERDEMDNVFKSSHESIENAVFLETVGEKA